MVVVQGYDIRLQIDGGVTVDNIKEVSSRPCHGFVLHDPVTVNLFIHAITWKIGILATKRQTIDHNTHICVLHTWMHMSGFSLLIQFFSDTNI